MNGQQPPVSLTSRILTYGSLSAAAILGVSLGLDVVGQSALARLSGEIGVMVLLGTPAAGLLATWSELRSQRPAHAVLALAVLGVLMLATVIALLARP